MMAEYTVRPGNRRYKQIDWGKQVMPPCSHALIFQLDEPSDQCDKPGEFDTPTKYGPWTDLCEDHLIEHTFRDIQAGYHRIPSE